MKILNLAYMVDVQVDRSEFLTLLEHKGRNLPNQVIRHGHWAQFGAVEATFNVTYLAHRQIYMHEVRVLVKQGEIGATQVFVFYLEASARFWLYVQLDSIVEVSLVSRHLEFVFSHFFMRAIFIKWITVARNQFANSCQGERHVLLQLFGLPH